MPEPEYTCGICHEPIVGDDPHTDDETGEDVHEECCRTCNPCPILVEVIGQPSGEHIGECRCGRPIYRSHTAGTIYHATEDGSARTETPEERTERVRQDQLEEDRREQLRGFYTAPRREES